MQTPRENEHQTRSPLQQRRDTALVLIALLGVLYTLHLAASILIPLTLAALLALLLNPLVRALARVHIPRAVSASLLLVAIGGPFTLVGLELAEPAQKWLQRAPELTLRVSEQLETISAALTPDQHSTPQVTESEDEKTGFDRILGWFSSDEASPEEADTAPQAKTGETVTNRLLTGGLDLTLRLLGEAPVLLAQCIAVFILVLFFLIYGPALYQTLIAAVPRAEDRASMARIALDTERQLSRYILTVSAINVSLGLVTAAALWLIEFPDPLLWGTMVGLLNFAPYVGPLISVVAISIAGLAQYGFAFASLAPAAVYFLINAVEAQLITPQALGLHMRMNPLVIMVWLMLWGWLWGIAGVLVAVPLLVCSKLVLAQVPRMQLWLRLIESRPQ